MWEPKSRVSSTVLRFLPGVFLGMCVLACSKPGDDSEAKRSPILEPAPNVKVPEGLSIPVSRGKTELTRITTASLQNRTPDFHDEERRAWRLDKLVGDEEFPDGAILEALGADGVGISMRRPKSDSEPLPVAILTRRGEIVAAVVRAADPFPDYHGKGGRLHRPGDPLPRLLTSMVRLQITLPSDITSATIQNLKLQIGDNPPTTISATLLKSLPSSRVSGDTGEERTVWNVRDIVNAVGGEKASLRAVQGDTTSTVDASLWADMSKRPVLQVNRRGQIKFQWLDASGGELAADAVRGVRLILMR